MYTQAHMDFVIETFKRIAENKDSIKGCRITYAPELLRHFTARFEPL
jgi:tryptophanase